MKKNIIARFFIKSESITDFKVFANEIIAETRKEEGCISYNLFQNINDNSEFVFVEEYRDEDAMKIHSGSAYLSEFRAKIKDFHSKDRIVEIF
jgi:quinol monooxygenase YgiN